MKKGILFTFLILVLLGGAVWYELQGSTSEEKKPTEIKEIPEDSQQESSFTESEPSPSDTPAPASSSTDFENFPPPTTEVVNGRTERTIHMGVRQYVWEPATITAKKGELVRLIIHNADVKHGIVIPELGVMEGDIPPEGAVIEFTASKVGTFEFFCSVYCGEGHMEMRGKIIIE